MFRTVLIVCCVIAGAVPPIASQSRDPDDADSILREVQRRQDLITSEFSEVRMEIIGKRGKKRTREMAVYSRSDNGDSRSVITFTSPPDIRGMGLLTIERDGPDDQRLYLPALGRVQRILGENRSDRFAGSDFSYEDLSSRNPDDYVSEIVSRSDSLVMVDSQPLEVESAYGRVVFTVNTRTFVVRSAEYYDKKNRLWKRLETDDIAQVGPETWRANRFLMTDVLEDRKTELVYLRRDTENPIPESTFTERWLRRGLQ